MSERPFASDECDLGAALAGHIGLLLAQVDAQHMLARLARTDPLTGLFNRRAFADEVERRLVRIRAGQGRGALVLIDLDNFKPINDRLGHAAGDEVLVAVAGHLTATVRGPDLVARLGGDEFAVWFEGVSGAVAKARATAIAKAAVTLAPASAAIGVPLGLSVGVAVMDSRGDASLADLTRRADGALYAAKAAGKGRVEMAS
jgi:diguanylate cyclase (GGDEF)-like protein